MRRSAKKIHMSLKIMSELPPDVDKNEFELLTDQLADLITRFTDKIPSLSDYAVSRSGIYEEHP